jgi:transaldolase
MKFFVDTADVAEIKDLAASGLLDGVTTDPSLIMKSARPMLEVIQEICAIVPGPVSAETVATDHQKMLEEGRKLAKNVAVKVPLTPDGLKTCKALASEGTVVQAAKMGAHVATVPPNVLRQCFKHVLTDNGLKAFLDDWAKTGQSIL